ncbi:MAG TPA: TonB-dependent receptor plug domain-containing protein [Gemmatimonadaceae bacterium]|nr:TonB-dependent receptor plug domain-containing protein [Gemmatimonadaceae bacterium]
MKQPGVYLYVRFAVLGIYLAASTACLRHSTTDTDAERAEARSADSARNARVEQSRSSATQVVDFEESERTRFTRVEQMIQARFSGVQVIPKGGGFTIQIRGTGSFGSSNEPLVVIDGASRSTADLRGIDPRDVERIEVVKDAAASFYGVRGANGVIVITTRRGR